MLKNGIGKIVPFSKKAILREASFDNGDTSLVIFDDKVSISQHECGEWDISVYDDPHSVYDDGLEAVEEFMRLCTKE